MLAAEAATAEALAEMDEISTAETLADQEASRENGEIDTAETQNEGFGLWIITGASAILALGVAGWFLWKQRQG